MYLYYKFTGSTGVCSYGVVVNFTDDGMINVCKDGDDLGKEPRIVAVDPSPQQEISEVENLPRFSPEWRELWNERFEWVTVKESEL